MYLSPTDKYWACDIEGDNLPSTVVWCMCACNIVTKEEVRLTTNKEIVSWIAERKKEGCKFVFHNGIGYDAPTLNRILKTRLVPSDIIDTFVMSQLYNPSLKGGHSLEEWGVRLRSAKIDFKDFSKLSPEMVTYCAQDAQLCRLVFLALVGRMKKVGFTERSLEIEHLAWGVIKNQQKNGFFFKLEEAHKLYAHVRSIENEIRDELYVHYPPTLQCVATYSKPYRKDGTFTANYQRHVEQFEKVELTLEREAYRCFEYVAFNIGSPPQRIEKLLELGWKPRKDERTPTGNPKPTRKGKLVPSLVAFVEASGRPEPLLIAQWISINALGNMLNTWIENYNETTGCIHGSLWLANTLRYRHSNPNTANAPGIKKDADDHPLFGREGGFAFEARNLWATRDPVERRMVGVDAKGIQLRILANYLNNPGFTANILSKDPHEANKILFGLPSRSLTKTITYATLMGAGDLKIAAESRVSLKEARETKAKFFAQLPELPNLITKLKGQVSKTGRIQLCDGSWIIVSSDHMVIPYLLQGDESKIMKVAMTNIFLQCRREGIDALQVGMIHDELQFDVLEKHVERFIEICLEAFLEAGKSFNYNIPTEGDPNVGLTWADTH